MEKSKLVLVVVASLIIIVSFYFILTPSNNIASSSLTVDNHCTSESLAWNVTQKSVYNYIVSQLPNATAYTNFNMRVAPLDLYTEANKYPRQRIYFNLTFTLDWYAEMFDTVEAITETDNGSAKLLVNVFYDQGFRIKVTPGQ